MKKIITLLLALTLLAALACPAAMAEAAPGWTLTEVGTINDMFGEIIFSQGLMLRQKGDFYVALNYLGEEFAPDVMMTSADYLGSNVWVIGTEAEGPNNYGLVNAAGEILVNFDAAGLNWPDNGVNGRFVLATYVVDPDDENGWYAQVYDLVNKRFVSNIPQLPYEDITACGNCFITKTADGVSAVYTAEGELIVELSDYVFVGDGIFKVSRNGKSFVFDDTGAQLYAGETTVDVEGKYLTSSDYDKDMAVIRDAQGNVLSQIKADYSAANWITGDLFNFSVDGLRGIVRADGTVIAEPVYDAVYDFDAWYSYGVEIESPVMYAKQVDGKYSLFNRNGLIVSDLDKFESSLAFHDGTAYLVLNDGSYSVAVEKDSAMAILPGLIKVNPDGKYGLVDLFTGTELLPCEYASIDLFGSYLYAYKGGSYTVYQLNTP